MGALGFSVTYLTCGWCSIPLNKSSLCSAVHVHHFSSSPALVDSPSLLSSIKSSMSNIVERVASYVSYSGLSNITSCECVGFMTGIGCSPLDIHLTILNTVGTSSSHLDFLLACSLLYSSSNMSSSPSSSAMSTSSNDSFALYLISLCLTSSIGITGAFFFMNVAHYCNDSLRLCSGSRKWSSIIIFLGTGLETGSGCQSLI